MPRKSRSDSVAAMLGAMESAALPELTPPKQCKLRDGDRPFWLAIVRARARDEWTDVQLVVAAQLARCQADIEREQARLDAESSVIENARGTPVMNPRVTVLEQLARREMAIMRSLQLAGSGRDLVKARSLESQARQVRSEIASEEDELLAR